MVQDVQTWVWITNETTLETIEAIGTSSFKIVEWRQTKWGRYMSGCSGKWDVEWTYQSGGSRESWVLKSQDTTITSSYWKQGFIMSNGGIRVPQQWTYQITLTWGWGGSTNDATIILKWGGKVIYTKKFTSSGTETVTVYADLGKFETIEIWGEFYYKGSASAASLWFIPVPTLKIQQL